MTEAVSHLTVCRDRLRTAQDQLRCSRRGYDVYRIAKSERCVCQSLDALWEAQLAAAAELIIDIGIDEAVRIGLGWKDDE